jgi:hypothetical protein
MELLLDAIVEPVAQGLGQTWEDDWFDDHGSGDQLDEGFGPVGAELDVSGDQAVLVTSEPVGGSEAPTSNPVLTATLT